MGTKTSHRRQAQRTRAQEEGAQALTAWIVPQTFGGTKFVYTLNDTPPEAYPHAKRAVVTE